MEQDRLALAEIRRLERELVRLLDEHGTTLRDEPGIGPIAAATLVVEVGDPFRFASESKFARWCGTGAVALSSGAGSATPIRHRLDYGGNRRINSVLYMASVTQQRFIGDARTYLDRKIGEGKTRRAARRAHKRHLANRVIRRMWKDESQRREPFALPPLDDKGASDTARARLVSALRRQLSGCLRVHGSACRGLLGLRRRRPSPDTRQRDLEFLFERGEGSSQAGQTTTCLRQEAGKGQGLVVD